MLVPTDGGRELNDVGIGPSVESVGCTKDNCASRNRPVLQLVVQV